MTKGMIFKQWEVLAALKDAKSQKRVPITVGNSFVNGHHATKEIREAWKSFAFDTAWVDQGPSPAGNPGPYLKAIEPDWNTTVRIFPRHQVGDVVFVKETWALKGQFKDGSAYYYRADQDQAVTWKSAYHMRQEYARLWYEITGVRVERVREISDADIEAEGTTFIPWLEEAFENLTRAGVKKKAWPNWIYYDAWEEMYPKYPFDTAWVWVYDLKKAEAPDG